MRTPAEKIEELLQRVGLNGISRPALVGVFLIVTLAIGLVVWRAAPGDETALVFDHGQDPAYAQGDSVETAERSIPESVPTATDIYVHIVGAVVSPGVYSLPTESRVGDAVSAAGGVLGNAAQAAVNMARPLVDGEQIVVLTIDEYDQQGSEIRQGGTAAQGTDPAKVDLNSSDALLLETLPGIGPTTAQRIIDDREENGPFAAPEDLMRVSGIGVKKFEAIADLVVVQ